MSLQRIVTALGGDLYAGGLRASVPAPGHSAADRSVSLLLDQGRVVVHSFGAATWREVLDDLRARGLLDQAGAPIGGAVTPRPETIAPAARQRIVRRLWDEAITIRPGSVAARHAARRGVRRRLSEIADLRLHPHAPLAIYRGGPATAPALLAAIRAAGGELAGLEITYLDPDGARARRIFRSRKVVGRVPSGAAVRLDPMSETLLVGEGVFTALSAGEHFCLPAWALLSTSNLRAWRAPPGVRRVLVAADRGPDGEVSARRLATRLRADGLEVAVHWPPSPFGDWNDLAVAGGGGRAGEGARIGGEASSSAGADPDP